MREALADATAAWGALAHLTAWLEAITGRLERGHAARTDLARLQTRLEGLANALQPTEKMTCEESDSRSCLRRVS